MATKKFYVGSATYKCSECGRTTRDTGHGEKSAMMCRSCYEQAEQDNADSDDGSTEPEPEETA